MPRGYRIVFIVRSCYFLGVFLTQSNRIWVIFSIFIWPHWRGHIDGALTGTTRQSRVDLGVMTMKGYTTLQMSPELEPQHQIHFSVIPRISLFAILSLVNRSIIIFLFNSTSELICTLFKKTSYKNVNSFHCT